MRTPRVLVRQGRRPVMVLGRATHETPAAGLPQRRRSSGGGAVLDGPWLLHAAVVLPRDHPLGFTGPVGAARWIGAVHAGWLQSLGIAAATGYDGPTLDHWACFAGRGPGEVLVGGRKLTGIAQAWRRDRILLSCATLLWPPPWQLLCDALQRPASDAALLAEVTSCMRASPATETEVERWAAGLHAALDRALDPPGWYRHLRASQTGNRISQIAIR